MSPRHPRVPPGSPVTLVHLPVRSLLPRGPRRSCGLFRALASLSRHLCSLCTDWVTPETQRQASPLTGALGSRQTDGRFQPDTGSRAGPCRSHGAQGKEAWQEFTATFSHTHTHSLMTAQERGSSDSWRHQGWTVPGSGWGCVSSVTTGRVGVQHGLQGAPVCGSGYESATRQPLCCQDRVGTGPTRAYGTQKGAEPSSLGLPESVSNVIKLAIFECFTA